MKTHVSKSLIGLFALDERGKVTKQALYKDVKSAAESLENPIDKGFLSSLKGDIVVGDEADDVLRRNFREIAKKHFKGNVNEFIVNTTIALSKKNMHGKIEMDRFLIQASNALEDLKSVENLLLERFTEWYRLHYPESKISHKELLENVLKYGRRDKFPEFEQSIGIDFDDEDERVIQDYAKMIKSVINQKKSKENYLKKKSISVFSNLSSVVDPLLAARIVAAAGSLEKLAKMPSSTIQLLGAEKALFRHLRKRGKSPKYGILFNDPRINGAPEDKRGKIARIISAKLAMAARIDFYSKRLDRRLKTDMDRDIGKVLE